MIRHCSWSSDSGGRTFRPTPPRLGSSLCGAGRQILLALLAVAGAALGWSPASAAPFIRPNIPDFFQHQNIDTDAAWEPKSGWCYDVAMIDAMYSLNLQPNYRGLYDTTATGPYPISDKIDQTTDWLDASSKAIKAMAAAPSVQKYLDDRNHGTNAGWRNSLTHDTYVFDNFDDPYIKDVKPNKGGYKGITGFTGDKKMKYFLPTKPGDAKEVAAFGATLVKPIDNFAKQLMVGGGAKGVTLQVGRGSNTEKKPVVWWGNFHQVAGAGVDLASKTVYFADPDSNKGSKKADAGWDFMDNYAPAIARKYKLPDDKNVPVAPVLDPANADWEKYYGKWTLNGDGFTVDGGVEAPDRYKGTTIRKVETISPSLAQILGQPILEQLNRWRTKVKVKSLGGELIDKIIIAPSSGLPADQFASLGTMPTDYDLGMGTKALWTTGAFTSTDPWSNTLSYGAVQYDFVSGVGGGGMLDEAGALTIELLTQDLPFTTFNVYAHYAGGGTLDWDVQSLNQTDLPFDHFQIPEPGAASLLTGACWALALVRRRRN